MIKILMIKQLLLKRTKWKNIAEFSVCRSMTRGIFTGCQAVNWMKTIQTFHRLNGRDNRLL